MEPALAAPPAEEIAAMRWYHTIELPGGIVTPGEYDLRPVMARLPFPPLEGLRCLDVGSRDGFYAFEMERRGAREIVSVDIDDPADVDTTADRPPEDVIRAELDAGNRAFAVARRALGSSVRRVSRSVYDLDRETLGGFDFVVIGALLLHLRDPGRALAAVRAVTDGRLLLNEPVPIGVEAWRGRPLAEAHMGNGAIWYLHTPAGFRRLLAAAGFHVISWSRPFLVPLGPGRRPQSLRRTLSGPVGDLPRRLVGRRGVLHCSVLASVAT